MISEAVLQALKKFVPEENISLREPMAAHTTFRVGGPADCFLQLENTDQLIHVQKYLRLVGVPFYILGNGSNILVGDMGYSGVILQIGQRMSGIETEGCRIRAQAGAALAQVARTAMEQGLTGLEFASGIPGTVGGGIVMNAGAYGGELSDVTERVTVVNRDDEVMELDNETMEFGYRTSVVRANALTVTEAVFRLKAGSREQIREKMEELAARRREKQPLEFPSAGSTFKRPTGYFAGKLIMDAGLRGYQSGGARVSDKHCGFVVNTGNATAQDVADVIHEVQDRVKEKFHVELEPEIQFLGV
ncbi:MAG: UDP-N-acetylmuramate dehydrogenase [Roseburia sp.]|nr:UDP-N-acetylmuramate dehydrogenase [Roseburia sp.]MCM1096572.1 UDP-N-acetylmuramate dehydrogenase [Ruminococcus flavefaciens]